MRTKRMRSLLGLYANETIRTIGTEKEEGIGSLVVLQTNFCNVILIHLS